MTIIILILMAIVATSCIQRKADLEKPELQADATWIITAGSTQMTIDPDHGGRIVSYTLNGEELLHLEPTPGLEDMVGSTCWISPQALWGWPPPFEADQGKYKVRLLDNKLILTGPVAITEGIDPFPFQIVKTFQAQHEDTSISILYQIFNRDTVARSFAAWEVMRVPPTGTAFFPINGQVYGDMAPAFDIADDIAWWDIDNNPDFVKKAYADGERGWLAYYNNNGILHIKQFEDTPSDFPWDENGMPLQMELEFWANEEKQYLEIEKQGAYKEIQPGDCATLKIKWLLTRIPDDLTQVNTLEFRNTLREYIYQGIGLTKKPAGKLATQCVKQK